MTKMRTITHISAGTQDWEPTIDQLSELVSIFMQAERDPKGAVVATRNGVTVTTYQIPETAPLDQLRDQIVDMAVAYAFCDISEDQAGLVNALLAVATEYKNQGGTVTHQYTRTGQTA